MYLYCVLPSPLDRLGIKGVAPVDAAWVVDTWEGGRQEAGKALTLKKAVDMGQGRGWSKGLPLLPQQAAPAAPAAVSDEALLAPWARYLGPGGKITGTLTLRPL
jgi:hypothetical protein